jgi:N-ethylmaleimide reductase
MTSNLFTPVELGAMALPNRVLLAPLTRNRADAGNVPSELALTYYVQRASGGLLITEATQVTPEGQGYPNTPGIHSEAQVQGWRKITDAVHKAGGRMVLQLWHVGRISHPVFQPGGKLPVSASAIAPEGHVYDPSWQKIPYVAPRALETSEIPSVVAQYAAGARNAKDAGFDGVEIHGANGYLIDQFLRDGSNKRTDAYGGSIDNRTRFMVEVVEAVTKIWDSGRVGIRLSPNNPYNSMSDSDPQALFTAVAAKLAPFKLAYIHLVNANPAAAAEFAPLAAAIKSAAATNLILNGGYTLERGNADIASGLADAIAFGKLFIANPDLPRRLREGRPLNTPDATTFYGGSAKGYTDYPTVIA